MLRRMIAVAAFAMLAAPACATAATRDNLQVAFTAETNAHARYVAFAEKAGEEGYPSVAALFRAAARAEEIHANNHADVIKVLGGQAKTGVETPVVKSTAANLASSLQREVYERDVMYPEFLRIARQENAGSAVFRTFNYAQSAEAAHADLLSAKCAAETYYVCKICGHTTTNLAFENCPSCADPKHDYEVVH